VTASPTVLEENSSPEAVDEPKSRHSRSRGACARCKKRRQKCDEQRPACGRCQESEIEKCTYTIDLRWGGRAFKSYTGNSDIKKYGMD
jgi:hypothetical protein